MYTRILFCNAVLFVTVHVVTDLPDQTCFVFSLCLSPPPPAFLKKKITTEDMTADVAPDWISLSEQAIGENKVSGHSKSGAGSFQRGRFQVNIISFIHSFILKYVPSNNDCMRGSKIIYG